MRSQDERVAIAQRHGLSWEITFRQDAPVDMNFALRNVDSLAGQADNALGGVILKSIFDQDDFAAKRLAQPLDEQVDQGSVTVAQGGSHARAADDIHRKNVLMEEKAADRRRKQHAQEYS
jgi:hypothetical protein